MKALGSSFPQIYIHGPVRDALKNNTPIVALESTIIAHGMPFPQNLHNAKALQDAVIQNGATPATVAVIHGVPHVGLTEAELHLLATHSSIRKLALRDLPSAFANRHHGATTVSATMHISCAVGIPVFATGGIGGVHRDVHLSWDISADIHALATIPQLVVCAGAKSILDIPKTLEALESASVPVFVLNSAKFPAFYTRDSGMPSPEVVKSERHAASVFHATRNTLRGGALLAVPVPEQHESDASVVQNATEQALRDMKKESLKPNQVTPFLLKRIAEITSGTSIETNMQLARNNACVAARVAVHLAKFQKGTTLSSQVGFSPEAQAFEARGPSATGLIANGGFANGNFAGEKREPKLLVVGGTALDIHCDSKQAIVLHSSNPGRIRQCAGGVGKNVAEAAMRLGGVSVSFVSCVGDDVAGEAVLSILRHSGFETDCIKRYKGRRTGVCCIVHGGNRDLTVS